jgi:hypothetical protein
MNNIYNEIEPINPVPTSFALDDKIFNICDEEGNQIGEPYSYNDHIKKIKSISGVNPDLMGIFDLNE